MTRGEKKFWESESRTSSRLDCFFLCSEREMEDWYPDIVDMVVDLEGVVGKGEAGRSE